MRACVCACMFLMGGQTAGPIRSKLGTRNHLDQGSISGKSRSISQRSNRENGGAGCADRDRGVVNAVGKSI